MKAKYIEKSYLKRHTQIVKTMLFKTYMEIIIKSIIMLILTPEW